MAWSVEKRIMDRLVEAERDQRFLVPASEADRAACQRRVGYGVSMTDRGVFARTAYWNRLGTRSRVLHGLRALSLHHPDWVFCGRSAAVVYGLALSAERIEHMYAGGGAVTPHLWNEHRPRTVFSEDDASEAPHDVDGVIVSGLYRTALDTMLGLPFSEAVALVDSLLRLYSVNRESFARYVEERGACRRGVNRVRQALAYADPLSRSGDESRLRATIIELGFEAPELQAPVYDPIDPRRRIQADYLWQLPDGTAIIAVLDGFGAGCTGDAWAVTANAMREPRQAGAGAELHVPSAAAHADSLGSGCQLCRVDMTPMQGRPRNPSWRVLRIAHDLIYDRAALEMLLNRYGVPKRPVRGRNVQALPALGVRLPRHAAHVMLARPA